MTAQLICPSCSRPIGQADDFCPKCGTALTTFATTDPILSIRAEGNMIRKAIEKPTPIVLIGMWLLFGPPLATLLMWIAFFLVYSIENVFWLLMVVPLGFFAWVYWSIVQRVTHRFMETRNKPEKQAKVFSEAGQPPGEHELIPDAPQGMLKSPVGKTPMTESEWVACTVPWQMMAFLRDMASDRKLRLYACACCRHIWHLVEDLPNQQAVEVAERYADGNATDEEKALANDNVVSADDDGEEPDPDDNQAWAVYEAQTAVWQCLSLTTLETCKRVPTSAASAVADAAGKHSSELWRSALGKEVAEQAKMLHDIFGNPFVHISFDSTWLTPKVVTLAQQIYDGRAFERLPILADSLEVAGCENADILEHCRGPSPHVRGCWVVDAVLGKK